MPTKSNGAAIRRLREEKGLNCSQLAEIANLGRDVVWKVENGTISGSPKTRLAIAKALGVDLAEITFFVKSPKSRLVEADAA